MPEPKTVRELNFVIEGVREAIGGKVNLILWALGAIVTIVVAIAGGGFLLLRDVGVVDKKVERLQADVQMVREQISGIRSQLSAGLAGVSTGQTDIRVALSRIEDRLRPADSYASFTLTDEQRRRILSFFNMPAKPTAPPKWKLGDLVPENVLKPIPDKLAEDIPALTGARFVFDPGGYVAIVTPSNFAPSNVVIAVVPLG